MRIIGVYSGYRYELGAEMSEKQLLKFLEIVKSPNWV